MSCPSRENIRGVAFVCRIPVRTGQLQPFGCCGGSAFRMPEVELHVGELVTLHFLWAVSISHAKCISLLSTRIFVDEPTLYDGHTPQAAGAHACAAQTLLHLSDSLTKILLKPIASQSDPCRDHRHL